MEIKEMQEFHPVLETLGLLYLRKNFQVLKGDILKNLADLDSDGAGFYQEHLTYLEDYVTSFGERYVPDPCEEFFLRYDTAFFLLVLQLFLTDPSLEEEIFSLTDAEARRRISSHISPDGAPRDLETGRERFALVAATELAEQTKWKLLLLLEDPQARLRALVEHFQRNRAAWEYAREKNRGTLERLRWEAREGCVQAVEKLLPEGAADPVRVYPAAVFPMSDWVLPKLVFRGLMTAKLALYRQGLNNAREALPVLLKCLGDRSKFEILCSLKERGKYNMELAADVGLSPATVSHHMGILLANQLVTVEKWSGKVYYQLNRAPIREMLRCMEDILL